jgi:hypothetical protein
MCRRGGANSIPVNFTSTSEALKSHCGQQPAEPREERDLPAQEQALRVRAEDRTMSHQAPTSDRVPASPAAERNVWNNVPTEERISSERERGWQIVVITTAMVVIGVTIVALLFLGWELPRLVRW